MANVPLHNDPNANRNEPCTVVAPQAVVILAVGMIAAWLAAGSTGLLAHSLQHALTWLALAIVFAAAWPRENRSPGTWAV